MNLTHASTAELLYEGVPSVAELLHGCPCCKVRAWTIRSDDFGHAHEHCFECLECGAVVTLRDWVQL